MEECQAHVLDREASAAHTIKQAHQAIDVFLQDLTFFSLAAPYFAGKLFSLVLQFFQATGFGSERISFRTELPELGKYAFKRLIRITVACTAECLRYPPAWFACFFNTLAAIVIGASAAIAPSYFCFFHIVVFRIHKPASQHHAHARKSSPDIRSFWRTAVLSVSFYYFLVPPFRMGFSNQ